jgi:hypothetical protein
MPAYPDPGNSYRRIPSGAIWLIALGVLFLFANTFHAIRGSFFGPILVIGVGVWLFVQKMLGSGPGIENDGTPMYQWRLARAMRSSFWVVLVGVLWLLDVLGILTWSRSWPLFMIVGGAMMFFRRAFYPGYGYGYAPPAAPPATPPATGASLVPTGQPSNPGNRDQEGR